MAMFQGNNTLKPDSRSRLGALQIGEHTTPSEDWVTDPTLPILLKNPYGGPGMEDVIVPMGRLIAIAAPVKVYTGKMKSSLTLANGSNPVIGVAPYNFVKDMSANDRFGGNKPAVITNNYIRLPYIPADGNSNLCPWGHVTGEAITFGDFLKPTTKGQFTKWVEGTDSINQRVGQILAQDFNQEVMGWLKMAMWEEAAKYDDEVFQNYYGSSGDGNGIVGGLPAGGSYDPRYKDGLINMEGNGYLNDQQLKYIGIPGLTDGSNRSLTRSEGKALGTVPAETADGDKLILQLKDETGVNNLVDVINSTDSTKKFVLKVDGTIVEEGTANGQYSINYKTGTIVYNALAADIGSAITADYCANFYGTPSYFDFRGAIGVFNVLLKM